MFRWKIAAETFAIEARDHAEAWSRREIERIADCHYRRSDFELLGISDRQGRAGQINFQQRDPAAEIGHQLACRILFPFELNVNVLRFAADRVSGVESSHRVNKKTGPGKSTVLIRGFDFYDGFAATLEDIFDFAANRSHRFRLLLNRYRRFRSRCLLAITSRDGEEGQRKCDLRGHRKLRSQQEIERKSRT